MPRIFGSSLLAILIATIVFYILGAIIYGALFSEQWMAFSGITQAEADAHSESLGPMMWVWGFLITLAQVLGIAYILDKANINSLVGGLSMGLVLAVLLALPVMAYSWLYEGTSASLLGLDFAHLAIGYALVGDILGWFRGRSS